MEPQTYTDEEMFDIMDGMEEANRIMDAQIQEAAPTCHFRKMGIEYSDEEASSESWWECSVCGHTKAI